MVNIPGSCGHCKYYDPVLDLCYLPNHKKCKDEVRIISPVMCPKCLWFDSSSASCSHDGVCPFVRSIEPDSAVGCLVGGDAL